MRPMRACHLGDGSISMPINSLPLCRVGPTIGHMVTVK